MAKPQAGVHTREPQRRLLRLSLDLHDGPMQDLVAVGFALERLRHDLGRLPVESSDLLRQIDGIREQLVDVEADLRAMAADEAAKARQTSFMRLLSNELERFRKLDDATVVVDSDTRIEPDTDSQRIALQRVLHEALTNIHKHAHARRVDVSLHEVDNVIHLEIKDDGVGFDSAEEHRSHGLGLSGMQSRLRLLGGELSVDSRPGGPTVISAAVRRWRPS
jgi:two-component system NarL family sensor kinase